MLSYQIIENNQLVLDRFGRWPSFHDGEVLRLVLDSTRKGLNGKNIPTVELLLYGWNMKDEISDSGFYTLENESAVHFLFEEVSDVELDGLNNQNVLSGLDVEVCKDGGKEAPLISVTLNHCYGLSGGFKARRASILSVVPYSRGGVV